MELKLSNISHGALGPDERPSPFSLSSDAADWITMTELSLTPCRQATIKVHKHYIGHFSHAVRRESEVDSRGSEWSDESSQWCQLCYIYLPKPPDLGRVLVANSI